MTASSKVLNVLVCCEFSGVVRSAFRELGHNAWSCDLIPAEDSQQFHIVCDAVEAVLELGPTSCGHYLRKDGERWDLVIAHPPCTFAANSGVRWLYNADGTRNEARWQSMRVGCKFFADLWRACGDIPRAFENPVMHCHAATELSLLNFSIPLGKNVRFFQPWEHGHPETKKTGLYLFNLPALKPSNIVLGEMRELSTAARSRVHYASPGVDRWKNRSRTLQGVAKAMATQWSEYISTSN